MEEQTNQKIQSTMTEQYSTDQYQLDLPFRLNCKESAKGNRYYEYTIKANSIEELQEYNQTMRNYIEALKKKDSQS